MEPYRSSFEPVLCTGWIRVIVDPIPNGSEHIRSRVNVALTLYRGGTKYTVGILAIRLVCRNLLFIECKTMVM